MKSVRCSGCGANLNFDGSRKIMKCQYCGTVYKDDSKYEKVEPLSEHQSTTTHTGNINIQVFETSGDRPKFKLGIFILWLAFGFFPVAIIYLILTKIRQKAWDDAHS